MTVGDSGRFEGFTSLELIWLLLGLSWCRRNCDPGGKFPELQDLYTEALAALSAIES